MSGLATAQRIEANELRLNDRADQANVVLRDAEAKLRGVISRASVPFEHPDYDDPHELAWSCRNGRWRLVLRWDDGADPVLAAPRHVRIAIASSKALQTLITKLAGSAT